MDEGMVRAIITARDVVDGQEWVIAGEIPSFVVSPDLDRRRALSELAGHRLAVTSIKVVLED